MKIMIAHILMAATACCCPQLVTAGDATNATPRVTHGQPRAVVAAKVKANAERRAAKAETSLRQRRERATRADPAEPLPHQSHRKQLRNRAR